MWCSPNFFSYKIKNLLFLSSQIIHILCYTRVLKNQVWEKLLYKHIYSKLRNILPEAGIWETLYFIKYLFCNLIILTSLFHVKHCPAHYLSKFSWYTSMTHYHYHTFYFWVVKSHLWLYTSITFPWILSFFPSFLLIFRGNLTWYPCK